MLRVRGVEEGLAEQVAAQLSKDPETALRLHVVAELGLNPEDKPSPWVAAVSSFLTFGTGALLPLLPYLFGVSVLWPALLFGGAGLLVAGALSSRFTPRPWWYAGLRQLLFGATAARMTYAVGAAIGGAVEAEPTLSELRRRSSRRHRPAGADQERGDPISRCLSSLPW